jgi:ribose transport system substrate-binding protein
MKRAVEILVFYIVFALTITSLTGCKKSIDLNNTEKKNIAIILKSNYGYYWGNLKMGAETASREFNVNIQFYAPDDEEDIEGQIKMVNKAVFEDKVDALVLAACDYNELVDVTKRVYSTGIPVILVDSELNTSEIHSYIGTDNYNAGKKAGNVIVDIAGKDCNIAIVNNTKTSRNAIQREEGLYSIISKYPNIEIVAKEYCLSDTKRAYSLTKDILSKNKNLDLIVALSETASEGSAQAVDEAGLQGKVKVVAFENTLYEIDMLEKGVIQSTIIQNPFSMGYLGVKNAVDVMGGERVEDRIFIDSKVIDRDNMYLPENQRLLFPMLK